jgi:putative transposase
MIEYKAKLLGIPIEYVDPAYSSKKCSKCLQIGKRNGKQFVCDSCNHVDHADVNAAFNIAKNQLKYGQSIAERDVMEGNSDIPEMAIPCNAGNHKPDSSALVGR